MNLIVGEAAETDVLVIGGGILGLALALQAACDGQRVTLLESGDFGGGATANSLRTVHGGLRYLQTFNLRRARISIRARRELMKLAPECVVPMEFRIPLVKWSIRSRLPMAGACLLADILGWDRNSGLSEGQRLPSTSVWRSRTVDSPVPGQSPVAAASWWDAVVLRPHSLTTKLLHLCESVGVRLLNYSRVNEIMVDTSSGNIRGVQFRDAITNTSSTISSGLVIDAAGHGGRTFRKRLPGWRPNCSWILAANVLIEGEQSQPWATGYRTNECAGIDASLKYGRKRDFFFVPTPQGTLAGTTYLALGPESDGRSVVSQALNQLLDEINRARPRRIVNEREVKHVYWGLLPGKIGKSGTASSRLLQRDFVIDGEKRFGLRGYWRVQGVKLTTAFELAAKVRPIMRPNVRTNREPKKQEAASNHHIRVANQGDRLSVGSTPNSHKELEAFTAKELQEFARHCVEFEYAKSLVDLLHRQLGLLPFQYPAVETRRALAVGMGEVLGWSETRLLEELDETDLRISAGPLGNVSREDLPLQGTIG